VPTTWLLMLVRVLLEAWSVRRDSRVRLLSAQIEMLRERLPGNRVILSPEERARLLKLADAVGHDAEDLIRIASVKTFKRWRRQAAAGELPRRVGRGRVITESVRELIGRIGRENHGWGVRRVVGELKKLGIRISRSSVRRVMIDEGLLPDPDRHAPKGVMTPWRTFVSAQANVMVATDFFCKTVWTPLGKRTAYVLVFIHLGTRKVTLSPATYQPTGEWVLQQGRNVQMWLEDEGLECEHLIHDHDTKYTSAFDELFRQQGVHLVEPPLQSPIANCYAESWIGGFKRECLNHLAIFSCGQLDYVMAEYARYFNELRPHQGLDNVPPGAVGRDPPEPVGAIGQEPVLGGLLNHYYRKAA